MYYVHYHLNGVKRTLETRNGMMAWSVFTGLAYDPFCGARFEYVKDLQEVTI